MGTLIRRGAWWRGCAFALTLGLTAWCVPTASAASPGLQTGELVGQPASGTFVREGAGVAISDDGSTALFGAPGLNSFSGGAFVFTRTGPTTWTQQTLLTASGATGLGGTVALSADGNTALVGGTSGAWVFTRSGSTWTQQVELVPTGGTGPAQSAVAVALSADGNTAVLGAPAQNGFVGDAVVFVRSGSTWSQQGGPLVASCIGTCTGPDGSGEVGAGLFGTSVSLAGDGNTAIIGAPGDGIAGGVTDTLSTGAAWVFTRSGSAWSQQGPKLVGSGAVGVAGQGSAVALSDDGTTALVGGPEDNAGVGAAWVFTRSGSSWSQQTKLIDNTGGEDTGASVSLSEDGDLALLGSPFAKASVGAALVFQRSGTSWTEGPELVGTGTVGPSSEQGSSVALTRDGNTALVGGPVDNHNLGAVWAFDLGPTATLTVEEAGTGSGSVSGGSLACPGHCTTTVPVGTALSLTATPGPNSTFAGWGGACTGTGTCQVTMSADATVTATFAPVPVRPACTMKPSTQVVLGTKRPGHGGPQHQSIGTVAVRVECNPGAKMKLTGVLSESVPSPHSHARHRVRRFQVGPVTRTLAGGVVQILLVSLPKPALAGLRQSARESLSLTLTAEDGAGRVVFRAYVPRLRGVP